MGACYIPSGQCYPGRVLEFERRPIEPGQTGEAAVGPMAHHADRVGLREGSVFELGDVGDNRDRYCHRV